MREFVPNRSKPIRIRREDVEQLPLLSRDDVRPWAPAEGHEWVLVVLEEGEEFQAWQVGRLVWVDVPQGHEIQGELRQHSCWPGLIVALPVTQARIAERTYLWLQVVGGKGSGE